MLLFIMKKTIIIGTFFLVLFLVSCTQVSESGVDLTNCKSYFDGCNTCSVVNGEIEMCTEIGCEFIDDNGNPTEKPEPECLEYY